MCYPSYSSDWTGITAGGSSSSSSGSITPEGTYNLQSEGLCAPPVSGLLLPKSYPTPWPTPLAYFPLTEVGWVWYPHVAAYQRHPVSFHLAVSLLDSLSSGWDLGAYGSVAMADRETLVRSKDGISHAEDCCLECCGPGGPALNYHSRTGLLQRNGTSQQAYLSVRPGLFVNMMQVVYASNLLVQAIVLLRTYPKQHLLIRCPGLVYLFNSSSGYL